MKLRKAIRKFVPFLFLCFMAAGIQAQKADVPVTGEEIVAGAWKAMFGERQNAEIRSLCFEAYFHGRPEPSRITIRRPNLFRNENAGGILVFDGRRAAWVKRAPDEAGTPRRPELIQPEHWRHFEVDIAIAFPAFFDYTAQLQGVEKVNGAEAYRMLVALPLGGRVTYFIDRASFLVVKRLVDWDGDPKAEPRENLVEGHMDLDGIRFPDGYSFAGREGREKGLYKNVRFNVEPADGLFSIPEDLR